ncbi:MAG: EscF/YscF/HrpA family type III secretion system needle major subunit [Pseudomonadota bacterium]
MSDIGAAGSLASSMTQIEGSMGSKYGELQSMLDDPDFGTDPSDLLDFQFKMNEWSTKYSAYSNAISSLFSSMKQCSQNLKV